MLRSSFFLLLTIFVIYCHGEMEAVTTTQAPKPVREISALETAIVLAGILAATTMSVMFVLVPTIIYHNYHRKKEDTKQLAEVH